MSKTNYQFNPETLQFDIIEKSIRKILLKNVIPNFLFSIGLGVLVYFVASFYIASPAEDILAESNNQLKLKYELLNSNLYKTSASLEKLQNRDDNVYRMIFDAAPIPNSIRKAGFGGSDRYSDLKGYEFSSTLINTSKKIDILSKQMIIQSKSYNEISEFIKNKEKMLASIPAIQPIAIKDLTRFGSPFGWRLHPIFHIMRMHSGVDLTAPQGTKIYAPGDGIVFQAEPRTGYGNVIKLNHGYGYSTVFGHLSKILVSPGQRVKRGDVIGLVGATGWATCPHLHYEVRINGTPVNPVNFYYDDLTNEEYEKMVEMSSTSDTHIFED